MFERRLKGARVSAKVTQKELGQAVGKGESTVCEWEKGTRTPDLSLLPIIASKLNVSMAYLIGETDDPTPTVKLSIKVDSTIKEKISFLKAQPGETISPTVLSKVLGGNPYVYNLEARAGRLTLPHVWRGRNLRIIKEPILTLLQGGLEK